jgi:hypothetical protein
MQLGIAYYVLQYQIANCINIIVGIASLFTLLHGVTVNKLLFLKGFGRCFKGSANQFSARLLTTLAYEVLVPSLFVYNVT